MNIRRWFLGIAIACGLLLVVISILAFAHAFAHVSIEARCFDSFRATQWPKWIGCAMAGHENLAGGLIGLAGAIFAAWIAYSAVQEQLEQAAETAKEAARLRVEEKYLETKRDYDELVAARDYLNSFVSHFPEVPTSKVTDSEEARFVTVMWELNRRAVFYVSQSAANAPRGFGRRIHTAVWRLERWAEQAEAAKAQRGSLAFLETEIRGTVASIRQVIAELNEFLPSLDAQVKNLYGQFVNLGGSSP